MALHEIYTSQDLKNFRDLINAGSETESAILMNDINLNGDTNNQWIPIGGINEYSFKGNFDGNGYTISGIYIDSISLTYTGFIGVCACVDTTNINIKNLTLEGYIKNSKSGAHSGGFIGISVSSHLYNCTNKIDMNNTSGYCGGVVGYTGGGSGAVIIDNCINEGNITASSGNTGGIIGTSAKQTDVIKNCTNKGDITNGHGIVANIYNNIGIKNCINKGNIIDGNGIADFITASVTDCINEGNIICNTKPSVNGICNTSNTSINNCINKGNITISASNTMINDAGGIAKYVLTQTTTKNCINTGNIINNSNRSINIGGIMSNSIGGTITNCVNMGNITDNNTNSTIGGIVGMFNGPTTVKYCVNTGNIISSGIQYTKGAIVGSFNIFPFISSTLSGLSTYFNNNYYLNTSCDVSIGNRRNFGPPQEDYINISTYENCFFNFSEGNAPSVASLIDTIVISDINISIKSKIYPYYNPNISNVSFNNWTVPNSLLAEIKNDIITFKRDGNITIDYDVTFTLLNGNKSLGSINIDDKYITTGKDFSLSIPCEIYTVQNLIDFRNLINIDGLVEISAKLMNNIDLHGDYNNQWIPIGISLDKPFRGNFNGNNHTISGIYINNNNLDYIGFIGCYVRDDSISTLNNIFNLTIEGYIENNRSNNYVGGLIGNIIGMSTFISNCTNKININNNQGQAGGIVGTSSGSDVYQDCINEGNIIGVGANHDQKSGGIICKHNGSAYIIRNCINKGNITNGNGIAGVTPGVTYDIIGCINKGNITNGNGIAGRIYSCKLIDCINEGNITNGNGIADEVFMNIENCINKGNITDGNGICNNFYASLINCTNEGDIICNTKTSISGMVDSFYGTNITNCLNKGNIIISEDNDNINFISGITCNMYGGTIKNCVNKGNINYLREKDVMIGGIISLIYSTTTISNCVNMGDINLNINNNAVGGIVGSFYTSNYTIKNCSNIGILSINGGTLNNKGSIAGDITFPIINSQISVIKSKYIDNFHQLDSFDKAIGCMHNYSGVNENDYLTITELEDAFYSFTEGNSPAVASIIENNVITTNVTVTPTIYPYYNPSISIVTFSDWNNTDDSIANIENDMIIFKQIGDITVGYKANFKLRDSTKVLNDVIVIDKLLKNTIKVKLYKMKYLKHYNNYLFCLFRETKH